MKKNELKLIIKEEIKKIINEGMSIYPDNINFQEENLKTIGGIADELKSHTRSRGFNPDGNDYFEPIGTINLYTNEIEEGKLKDVLKSAIEFLKSKNIKGVTKTDMSKSRNGVKVIRFNITQNPNANIPLVPEFHISYGTANVIFNEILNLPNAIQDYQLSINVDELENAINDLNVKNDFEFTADYGKYGTFIKQLKDMVNYAKRTGANRIIGS